MTMITPSYLGETIEYSSLHACRSTLEDPTKLIAVILDFMTLQRGQGDNDELDSGFLLEGRQLRGDIGRRARIEQMRIVHHTPGKRWKHQRGGASRMRPESESKKK